jgi:hypothetical protein
MEGWPLICPKPWDEKTAFVFFQTAAVFFQMAFVFFQTAAVFIGKISKDESGRQFRR